MYSAALKRISAVKNCNKNAVRRMPEFRILNLKIPEAYNDKFRPSPGFKNENL